MLKIYHHCYKSDLSGDRERPTGEVWEMLQWPPSPEFKCGPCGETESGEERSLEGENLRTLSVFSDGGSHAEEINQD
ncbi:unnamed protein product [Allacma fusca]|uniref:Uncharacterized protein n=1 Tax=Allacma fusca TaxID=39272 RepID=A0A8J2JKK3_9HEXA|nr:unnamed protein product [Allacma fusca]